MNVPRCTSFMCLLVILSIIVSITMAVIPDEKISTAFPGDFENFLKGLGSMVYKYKKPRLDDGRRFRNEYSYITTKASKILRRNEIPFRTQKDALRDVLMMKLVSYYENKYKITHHEALTTTTEEVSTTVDTTTIMTTDAPTTVAETYATTTPFIIRWPTRNRRVDEGIEEVVAI